MQYFTKGFLGFLEGLSLNNDRAWFDEHRKTYEQEVKRPYEVFVADLIERIKEHEPGLRMTPREAIFRINRDTRFSKDKSPYKTHMGAIIGLGGKRGADKTGFYVHLAHDEAYTAGGAYEVSPKAVERIRKAIARRPDEFAALLKDRKFKSTFGTMRGEKHKRVPPEFRKVHEKQPFIANKQFYWMADLGGPEAALRKDLLEHVMKRYVAGQGMTRFLDDALWR
jgi:uncharacterized protein (TIGR02453 family)